MSQSSLKSKYQYVDTYEDDQENGNNEVVQILSIDEALSYVKTGKFQYLSLLVAGLSFAGNAVEVTLSTFLSPCIQTGIWYMLSNFTQHSCTMHALIPFTHSHHIFKTEWNLSNIDIANLTSCVFAGAMIGSILLGKESECYSASYLCVSYIQCFCVLYI